MLSHLIHRFFPPPTPAQSGIMASLPLVQDGGCLYVVGDLHGCAGLLRRIETAILQDMRGGSAQLVLLGDVIDRGPDSAAVMDHLLRRPPPGLTRHVILGNHEAMFLQFLENPAATISWLDFGGRETLASYGIDPAGFAAMPAKHQRHQIDANIPHLHRAYLAGLPAVITWGNYVFAHAGFDFAIALAAQTEDTLLWRRSPTAPQTVPQGLILVHGHFPNDAPDLGSAVINMDVGAYITNRGCILRLDAAGHRRLIEI